MCAGKESSLLQLPWAQGCLGSLLKCKFKVTSLTGVSGVGPRSQHVL